MKYDFRQSHGAKLVNQVVTFLKMKNINPIPHLENFQKRKMYSSESSQLIITFYTLKQNHGYFEIRMDVNGAPQIIKTPVFFYII